MLTLHRLAPPVLALSLVLVSGCQSRDERVCAHIHQLMADKLASYDKDPGDPKEGVQKCVSMKTETGATEQEWTAYIDCAEKAKVWGDAEVCMLDLGMAVGKRKAGSS